MVAAPCESSTSGPVRRLVGAAALFGCLALVSCAGAASTKAGGAVDEVVTLTIVTPDFPGRLGADQVTDYARRVHELSEGTMRVDPVFDVLGPEVRQWDQRIARMVAGGELDMGLIPARAWDTEGVLSMRALHAPFLVTEREVLQQVLSGEMAGTMLAGLEPIGLTGLDFLIEGMRYIVSYDAALTTPESLDGLTIRGPWSATSSATFEALGATLVDLNGAEFRSAVADSAIDALEMGVELRVTRGDVMPTSVAGDLVLWPKVNTLVVNTDRFAQLSDLQQEWLRTAAADAASQALSEYPGEASLIGDFCTRGGEVVLAGDDVREQFIEAVAPVYEELERDEVTARLIAEIRDLADKMPVDPGSGATLCQPDDETATVDDASPMADAGASDTPTGTAPEPSLDGVYRVEWTEAWLREMVTPFVDEFTLQSVLYSDVGVWELTFDDGHFEAWRVGDVERCLAGYSTLTGRLVITAIPEVDSWCSDVVPGGVLVDARYDVVGSELHLTDFRLSESVDLTWWFSLMGELPPQRTA